LDTSETLLECHSMTGDPKNQDLAKFRKHRTTKVRF